MQTIYILFVLNTRPDADLLILGAGPAARLLAASCLERGLSVQVVAPDPDARWAQRFGAWRDELVGLPADLVAHTWSGASVHTSRRHHLDRPYVRLSTARLQDWLVARTDAAGHVRGAAVAIRHDRDGGTVTLRDGRVLTARLIVDATGSGRLLERRDGPAAWQTAYGLHLTLPDGHPWPLDEIGLMDLRGPDSRPSFLYVQPLDAQRVFVEETALIASPELPIAVLRDRLLARLRVMGVAPTRAADEERCRIQMLGPPPVLGQRTLGFGAAAGMVHPATGYLLARLPQAASEVADALVASLPDGPQAASAAAWSALWPAARQRQWALYRFGAQILCDLDAPDTRRFFDAFFQIEPALWSGFLSATLPPMGLAAAMSAVFSAASLTTRRHLLAAGASGTGIDLLLSLSRPSL